MIWIFTFAKSGSSLFQNVLVDHLGVAKVFEPFGENCRFFAGEDIGDAIEHYFRGAPNS